MSDGDVHPAGYGQAGRGAAAAHQGEDGILNLLFFLPLDMCGEMPDGDLHSAGYGQAGGGAGAGHQGEDAAVLQPAAGAGVRQALRTAARQQQHLSALVQYMSFFLYFYGSGSDF